MAARGPSRTALAVAVHRAVHQISEGGRIFSDPFAGIILGPDSDALIAARSAPQHRHMRLFVAVRSRFAEFGAEPMATTPEELGRFISSEVIKWREIITKAGITLD